MRRFCCLNSSICIFKYAGRRNIKYNCRYVENVSLNEHLFVPKHIILATNSMTAPIKVELFELIELEEVIINCFLFISLLVCKNTFFPSHAYKMKLLPPTSSQLCRPSHRLSANRQRSLTSKNKTCRRRELF